MNEAPIGGFADVEPTAVRTLPRVAIRIFWLVHRAGYRLSGGRLGLARPEAGTKFGLMRLTTLGRRSRQPRVAIIGYYEDGPNLVTLAMNGWGRVDPAWWLNLQATPEAMVELVGGPRSVRARIASGNERERLWAKFVDYPGWGDDLDGLAARRPSPTAVVVLEPQDARPGSDADVTDALDSPATASGPQGAGVAASKQVTGRRLRLRPRHLWLLPGIGLALFANTQASQLGVGLVPLLVFGIAPDLPRFVGLRRPAMLMVHNTTHQPALALAVLLGSAVTGLSPFFYIGALAWLGHIVVGWGTGDRIRSTEAPVLAKSRAVLAGPLVLAPEPARNPTR
jgi:deazaflavin-dependent oxidoreductase (nitroreductase family)